MTGGPRMIHVDHLNFAYPGVDDTPGVAVFTDMNLSIEEGTFVAVLGTNGCGKSTLLKCLCGIHVPKSGVVMMEEENWRIEKLYLRRRYLQQFITISVRTACTSTRSILSRRRAALIR